jgi:D-beta-D-heptose 7-phosphate kinase/D-beta-D-heptose 1-phosphate adenosyltransferase
MLEVIDALRRSDVRLLVLGDIILDQYTFGEGERVSPEAPALVLRSDRREARLGGAGFVAAVLRGLGARVTLAGVVGDDANGRTAEQLLTGTGADVSLLLRDNDRPTTTKERFLGRIGKRDAQQVLRVDHEVNHALRCDFQRRLIQQLAEAIAQHDAVLVSDYAKGVCTPRILEALIETAKAHNVPVIVDPARGVDYRRYRGATLLAPNRVEAEAASGILIQSPRDAWDAGRRLCGLCDLNAVIVKLDRDGIALVQWDKPYKLIPSRAQAALDVTGAGDVVLALLGLCQAAGIALEQAVEIANAAAGAEVGKVGAATLTWREIYESVEPSLAPFGRKIVTLADLPPLAESYRERGKPIVFSNGCFDLLHLGHVTHLQEASRLGDVLVVAINSDHSVERLKGSGRPVIPEEDRVAMLAALECVDHVLVFDEDTPHELLNQLRPDVLAKGGATADVIGREVVESYGGRIHLTSQVASVSTTEILAAVRAQKPRCGRCIGAPPATGRLQNVVEHLREGKEVDHAVPSG